VTAKPTTDIYDIAIVGGGLTGFAAALASAKAGRAVVFFAPQGRPDRRTSALMAPSIEILADLGLASSPAELGTLLSEIRIIDATRRLVRSGETLFKAADAGLEAFGYNLPNAGLLAALGEVALARPGLHIVHAAATGFARTEAGFEIEADDATFAARLLVGADGKNSPVRHFAGFEVRRKAHAQSALVADLDLGRPLGGCSVEFHYENGPFTLVPAGGNKANLVWIDKAEVLADAAALPGRPLAARFEALCTNLYGTMTLTAGPHIFPLEQLLVPQPGENGVVLVGEAAHAFAPIGAQGLNLGLRDVAALGRQLGGADSSSSGWADSVSKGYCVDHAADITRTGMFVGGLFASLLSNWLPAQMARSTTMWALRRSPELRRRAFALGMGVK
jgi:2-octaprenyl-6-methoxyphenol hydroxylase